MYTIIIKKDNREISRNYGDGFFQSDSIADAMIDMAETLAADYPKSWDEPGIRNLKGEKLQESPMNPVGTFQSAYGGIKDLIPDEIVEQQIEEMLLEKHNN